MSNLSPEIFFDIDDTLLNNYKAFEQAMMEVFPKLLDTVNIKELYLKFRETSERCFQALSGRKLPEGCMNRLRLKSCFLGVSTLSNEECQKFVASYKKYQTRLQLEEEVQSFLIACQQSGVKLGIISNGRIETQREKIKQLGLEAYISSERVVISEEVGRMKPDERIFEYVEERFELVPENTIYIGDSLKNDMRPTHARFWQSYWFNPFKQVSGEQPFKKEITSFDELSNELFHGD
ncbi:MAG: HAD family hydrolase [Lactobacillales bacterium]|jgi:putative hydrolase of the HAD superfamily|nr:HAD family hydrolase [Lactobacillales bacterium]